MMSALGCAGVLLLPHPVRRKKEDAAMINCKEGSICFFILSPHIFA
jgi:hypothetical protein